MSEESTSRWGARLRSSPEHAKAIREAAAELNLRLLWGEPIEPGDMYLAARNTGPQLLTCLSLGGSHLGEEWVVPAEANYPYDFSECVKVEEG